MARDLTGAGTFLSANSPIAGLPCTIAMWIKPSATSTSTIAGVSDNSNNNRVYIQGATAVDPRAARAVEVSAGSSAGTSTPDTPVANGAWAHWAATFASSTLRTIFVNGIDKTSNGSGLGALATLTKLYVGASGAGVVAARFEVAEIGIWSVVLSDSDIALLGSSKYSPGLVDPTHLVGYWKLLGTTSPEPNEVSGGAALALTGAPLQSAHPPGIVYTLAVDAPGYFWSKGQIAAYLTATDIFAHFHQTAATTDGDWEDQVTIPIPKVMEVSWRYDSSGVQSFPGPYVTVNFIGEVFTTGPEKILPVGAITSDAGSNLVIGNKASLDSAFQGHISEFILWDKTYLTSPQMNALYMDRQTYYGVP